MHCTDKKQKISATIITFNEEKNIARAINSLRWADEIIVVDSMSQDKTASIAEKMGAKVIKKKFSWYYAQKQLAVSLASHDWIIALDADEEVSDELRKSILERVNNGTLDEFDGYFFNVKNFILNHWLKYGGFFKNQHLRLFNRKRGCWKGPDPHEYVAVEGRALVLKGKLLHRTAEDLDYLVYKRNKYSYLQAREKFRNNVKFSLLRLIISPWIQFMRRYIINGGFLDGTAGFIEAIQYSQSVFLKYAKLWDLHEQDKKQKAGKKL